KLYLVTDFLSAPCGRSFIWRTVRNLQPVMSQEAEHARDSAAVHPAHAGLREWQRSTSYPEGNGKETTEADQALKQEAVGTATSTREVVNRSNHGTLSRCRTGGRLAHSFSSRQ